jgi:hypothetical protein
MSYRPTPEWADSPFFFAYRSTAVTVSGTNTPIPFTDVEYAEQTSITGGVVPSLSSTKAYAVGECRTSNASIYHFNDIDIKENTGELSKGYQVQNNAQGTVLMDDACYGVIPQSSDATMRRAQFYSADPDPTVSDAYETRLMGVRTS